MTKRNLLLAFVLMFGLIAPMFAADNSETKTVLTEDQIYNVRYAVMLINEGDIMHAAWVIEPLINDVPDVETMNVLQGAYNMLYMGSYEDVSRARYLLMSLL